MRNLGILFRKYLLLLLLQRAIVRTIYGFQKNEKF